MFTLTENPTFAHDIDVAVPVDGGYEQRKLKVRFRVLDADTLIGFDLSTAEGQTRFCDQVVEGFEDLQSPDGKPVTCNDRIRKQLTGTPYIRSALMAHYTRALIQAERKN